MPFNDHNLLMTMMMMMKTITLSFHLSLLFSIHTWFLMMMTMTMLTMVIIVNSKKKISLINLCKGFVPFSTIFFSKKKNFRINPRYPTIKKQNKKKNGCVIHEKSCCLNVCVCLFANDNYYFTIYLSIYLWWWWI